MKTALPAPSRPPARRACAPGIARAAPAVFAALVVAALLADTGAAPAVAPAIPPADESGEETGDAGRIRVGPPTDLVCGASRVMHSVVLGERRVFYVHLPRGYGESDDRYPVLVVLDGDLNHAWVAETARYLRMNGSLPGLIVVGVANVDRDRDLTPCAVEDVPASGGASRFLRFLKDELLPFLDLEYRTAPYRILYGHSLGGLFAIHTLFTDPGAFQACIAPSPALYYDRGRTLGRIEEAVAGGVVLRKFLYTGQAGELTYPEAMAHLRGILERHRPAGLRWTALDLEELDHGTIPLRILPDGLRELFRSWPLAAETLDAGLEAVLAHHRRLSEEFGYEIAPSEGLVNRLGYRFLERGELARAREIFAWNARAHPDAFNTWDSLAEAWLRLGDREQAIRFYRRSLELNPANDNARRVLAELGVRDVPAAAAEPAPGDR